MTEQKLVLRVAGMTRADSEQAVASALRAVPGVKGVEVSPADGTATLTHDGAPPSMDAVRAALDEAGFHMV
jgi:copper chaperone CopZ